MKPAGGLNAPPSSPLVNRPPRSVVEPERLVCWVRDRVRKSYLRLEEPTRGAARRGRGLHSPSSGFFNLVGHDTNAVGQMSFVHSDHVNTFSARVPMLSGLHAGVIVVGITSLAILVMWSRVSAFRKSPVPSAVVVVVGLEVAARSTGQVAT
jgi:hypothetical protein